jgi:hypothetical protein
LPAGESCNEVIVFAVRFQKRVSFADAEIGMNVKTKTKRAAGRTISLSFQMLHRIARDTLGILNILLLAIGDAYRKLQVSPVRRDDAFWNCGADFDQHCRIRGLERLRRGCSERCGFPV